MRCSGKLYFASLTLFFTSTEGESYKGSLHNSVTTMSALIGIKFVPFCRFTAGTSYEPTGKAYRWKYGVLGTISLMIL